MGGKIVRKNLRNGIRSRGDPSPEFRKKAE